MNRFLFAGLVIAAGLAALALYYGPFLSPAYSFAPWHDTIYLTGPTFCEISRSVQSGGSPVMNWSTYEALDSNAHVAAYYPLYLFGFLNFCSAFDAGQAHDVISVLQLAIFFATMTSLIRAT